MRPIPSARIFARFRTACLSAAAAALALAGCDERLAGTSVGTGNPTEIKLGFRDGTGSAAISGRVSVYAATQIPVEGYRPEPLLQYPLQDARSATLRAGDFAALADSLWDEGSVEGSLYSFNVVVTGDSLGSLWSGLRYDKAKGEFRLRPEDVDTVWDEAHTVVALGDSLRGLVDMKGMMDTSTITSQRDYHLFLYGTGIKSKVENGSFVFHAVPDGKYDAFLISLPQKDHPGSGEKFTEVFSTSASLSAGANTLARGELHDQVPLPDSLISR